MVQKPTCLFFAVAVVAACVACTAKLDVKTQSAGTGDLQPPDELGEQNVGGQDGTEAGDLDDAGDVE